MDWGSDEEDVGLWHDVPTGPWQKSVAKRGCPHDDPDDDELSGRSRRRRSARSTHGDDSAKLALDASAASHCANGPSTRIGRTVAVDRARRIADFRRGGCNPFVIAAAMVPARVECPLVRVDNWHEIFSNGPIAWMAHLVTDPERAPR